MRTWVIGDIQGCYKSLQRLLQAIAFDARYDTLWFVGDLVNRGKGSLEVLRFLYDMQDRVVSVLGNHDLALLAAYWGFKKSNLTIDPILQAHDADRLIAWLRHRPFLHVDYKLGAALAHAGVSPEFDLGMALHYAKRVERKLQSDQGAAWLEQVMKEGKDRFDRKASEIDIDRYIVSSFTRMRFCHTDGRLDFKQKGAPSKKLREKGLIPWFLCPKRKTIDLHILFGHWSTLGFYSDEQVTAIDTGCVWGGELSALEISKRPFRRQSIVCDGAMTPET